MKKKLAVVTTHPIQYYAPLFRMLQERGNVAVKVFYTWGDEVLREKYDPGFKQVVTWDIPLLDGYEYEFPENVASDKGSHHFSGIDNPGLNKSIEAFVPDAILVIGWSYKSHLAVLRRFKGKIPILFRGDSTLLDKARGLSVKKILRKQVLKWIYRHVDTALYVGTNNKEYYKKFGLKERQLVYAPHAIDNERFAGLSGKDYEAEAMLARRQLGIGDDDVVFLFAGKLEPKKAPELLVRAFVELSIPGTRLVMTGNGISEDMLKEMAGERSDIHFIGFQNQSQMPMVYRMADVFVLPSRGPDETWGLAINEAMASGRAVLASDKCGGAIDLICNGENGYVFVADNINELKNAMFKMAKADLKQMGLKSAELVKNFDFLHIVKAIELCLK